MKTKKSAEEIVSAAKYTPEGSRGVGFSRSNAYGCNLSKSVPNDNEETFVCIQVEHKKAVMNIESIASLNNIDAVLIGKYDLSASLGVTERFEHPKFQKAVGKVKKYCKKHNTSLGIHVVQPSVSKVVRYLDEGYKFVAYSLDITMLSEKFSEDLRKIKKKSLIT